MAICSPLEVELRGGRLLRGKRAQDLEKEFWGIVTPTKNNDRVGELAFGTNLACRK
jgi:hypothetical protein